MLILGIDPGVSLMGYGIISSTNNTVLEYGCINTTPYKALQKKLHKIYEDLSLIIDKHKPDVLAVEELFFAKNVKTAIKVGHGRGIVFLCAEHNKIPVFEYTPLQVKQAVVGYGRAEKFQVQKMVANILKIEVPKQDDAADALAIALCHKHTKKYKYYG